jgi:uncharacterized protein
MIHPNTELKFINDIVGYGVFATSDIPEGTIIYVKDSLEISISQLQYQLETKEMQEVIEKFSYIDENGNRIISWDFAKYVNHCCNCNTISTGYGFEIAIRDIAAGEQITDEYGLFNIEQEMELVCCEQCCRKKLTPQDFDLYYQNWDEKIKPSLNKIFSVDQPLAAYLEENTRKEVEMYLNNPDKYKSVYTLKYHKEHKLNGQKKVMV